MASFPLYKDVVVFYNRAHNSIHIHQELTHRLQYTRKYFMIFLTNFHYKNVFAWCNNKWAEREKFRSIGSVRYLDESWLHTLLLCCCARWNLGQQPPPLLCSSSFVLLFFPSSSCWGLIKRRETESCCLSRSISSVLVTSDSDFLIQFIFFYVTVRQYQFHDETFRYRIHPYRGK